ncbi:MAG: hypothetical protein MR380_02590 [Lachnospiraceae bacterium]|nr:hypothetical protein [Lachnospiraceae bacterium]
MKKKFFSLILLSLFFLFLIFPETVQAGAKEGLALWYNTMIPILFPFILISNLLIATDSVRYFTYPIIPLLRWFPYLNPYYFYALIFGWFCGYPMGAKSIADLLRTGKITKQEANFLLPAVNQASPMFLIGYLGIHIFEKSYSFGQILLIIYGPVLFFLISGLFLFNPSKNERILAPSYKKNSMSLSMEHTIISSFQIMVNIGVYMMIFTILMRLLLLLLPESPLLTLFIGFLEMSTGIAWIHHLSFLTPFVKGSLIFALTAFGGFCTMAQTYSVTEGLHLSIPFYLVAKILLGTLSFCMAFYLL